MTFHNDPMLVLKQSMHPQNHPAYKERCHGVMLSMGQTVLQLVTRLVPHKVSSRKTDASKDESMIAAVIYYTPCTVLPRKVAVKDQIQGAAHHVSVQDNRIPRDSALDVMPRVRRATLPGLATAAHQHAH